MIGRNDPCLCGSGKKYKKCCALKNELSSEALIEEELERIISSFYRNALDSPADTAELERYERAWNRKLGGSLDSGTIEQVVAEYFLFVARRDLWRRHLVKVLNGSIRSATHAVLETWKNPIVLFGKVKDIKENHFLVDEVLGHLTYRVNLAEGMKVEENLLVFGVVLPDSRNHETGVRILDGLTFIYDTNGEFAQSIASMAETSGADNSYDFFKTHMLDIHKAIIDREMNSMNDLVDNELSPEQQEVMVILENELNPLNLPGKQLEFTKMIAIRYLLNEQVIFRKPEIVAAAVFKVAYDYELFGDQWYSQTDIAKMFGVSVGSMMKHADVLYDVIAELAESLENHANSDSDFTAAYWIGTDPWMTERVNWETYCKMSTMDFDTFEATQNYLNATMNEPFKPSGQKQQAQAFAYNAYEAESNGERYRLAKKAYAHDVENVDAVLLQAEMATADDDAERLYQKAIKLGEAQFDPEPEITWGLVTNRPYMRAIFAFGIWLYEHEQFGKAAELFKRLLTINPTDNQGARYVAISAFVYDGNYSKAKRVLEEYEEGTDYDAPYLFLKWLVETERAEEEVDLEFLHVAVQANPLVALLIEDDAPRLPYPVQASITPGSMEEAQYIWWLL